MIGWSSFWVEANGTRNSFNGGIISRPTAAQLSNMTKDSMMGPGHVNTNFLFEDEESHARKAQQATSPDVKSYLQMNANDDRFPILVSRDTSGLVSGLYTHNMSSICLLSQLSASSAALDLALSQRPQSETHSVIGGWSNAGRQRQAHQSLSASGFSSFAASGMGSNLHGNYMPDPQTASRRYERSSFSEFKLPRADNDNTFGLQNLNLQPAFPKLQSSYSTSDLPTVHNTGASYPRMTTFSDRHPRRESTTSDLSHIVSTNVPCLHHVQY